MKTDERLYDVHRVYGTGPSKFVEGWMGRFTEQECNQTKERLAGRGFAASECDRVYEQRGTNWSRVTFVEVL